MLRNNPEERGSHLPQGVNLKSPKFGKEISDKIMILYAYKHSCKHSLVKAEKNKKVGYAVLFGVM